MKPKPELLRNARIDYDHGTHDVMARITLAVAIYGNYGNVISAQIHERKEWDATRTWFAFRKAGYKPWEIVEYFMQYDPNAYWYEGDNAEDFIQREPYLCEG